MLIPYLVSTYLRQLTGLDGWQRPIYYQADDLSHTVASYGSDAVAQSSLTPFATTSFNDDIVVSNGVFVRWLDGMQTN